MWLGPLPAQRCPASGTEPAVRRLGETVNGAAAQEEKTVVLEVWPGLWEVIYFLDLFNVGKTSGGYIGINHQI